MTNSFDRKPVLENLLLVMGFGGIGLTLLVSSYLAIVSVLLPDGGVGLMHGFVVGVAGFTAGVGLIALSRILGYLRVIAVGSASGKVFE